MDERETRCFRSELRAVTDADGKKKICGRASVFYMLSEDLGGWREKVLPGAFDEVLEDDVRALFNHDPSLILGRTVSGTLRVSQDASGLGYEIDPPETSYATDLMVSLERGDVDQSSFQFIVGEESWINPTPEQPYPVRCIHKFRNLFDVSPVTFPAYVATSAQARDKARAMADGTARDGAIGDGNKRATEAARGLAERRRIIQLHGG